LAAHAAEQVEKDHRAQPWTAVEPAAKTSKTTTTSQAKSSTSISPDMRRD
jgi:hypothetical protein